MADKNKISIYEINKLKEEQKKEDKNGYKYYNFLHKNDNKKENEIKKYKYNKDFNITKEEKGIYNNKGLIKIFIITEIIKSVLIMSLIYHISSKINYPENLLFNSSEIILKINKIGIINILHKEHLNKYYPCPSSIYLNDSIQNLGDCTLIKIDTPGSIVKLVWDTPLYSAVCLFCRCSNIAEIKFLNFDTSSITDMDGLFQDCDSLTSIDVSNLNINNVNLMVNMFCNCKSLISIDLSNFNNTKVTEMYQLFYNCNNLEYINLLNFNDKNKPSITDMFNGIKKNAVICIDKNNAPSIYDLANNMSCVVISCESDWRSIQKKIVKQTGECYDTCPDNTILYNNLCYSNDELCDSSCKTCYFERNIPSSNCSSCYNNKYLKNGSCVDTCEDGYTYYDSINNINYCTSDCSNQKDFNKLIPAKKQCIDDCQKYSEYKYEFRHICYKECPYNISVKSEIKNFYCEVKCTFEFPFEIIETQNCVNSCTISQRERGICIIYKSANEDNKAENEKIKEIETKTVENIKEELTNGFDTSDVDRGKNIIIGQKHSTITITTTENQKNETLSNLTTIDLGECEAKLKDKNNISNNKSLYLLKIDVKQDGLKIPKIVYEVYYPLFGDNLIKLNLTECKDSKIEISIPVVLNDDIDKINPTSGYYNDICYTYTSEDGTDISLSDRKNDFINNNLTVCEEDCNFNGYNYTTGKAICSSNVQTNPTIKIGDIIFDKNKLYDSFTNIKNIMNLNVLKCYKLIFNLESFKRNYSNMIMIIIIIIFIFSFFFFYCKDYFNLKKILNIIVYFQLNPNLVKKFLNQKKRENKTHLKK